MTYLCRCNQIFYNMTNEEQMKEKAKTYLVCFNSGCAQREHCLRWLVSHHVPVDQKFITCINPNYAARISAACPYYRDCKPVRIPKGMIHFYDKMPSLTERAIKAELIARFTRVGYYKLRNGKRQITPEIESEIIKVCASHGWTGPLVFDEYVEEMLW